MICLYQTNVETLATQTLNFFAENGYAQGSITERKTGFSKIIELHHQYGCQEYNPKLMNLFIEKTKEQYANSEFSKSRYRFYVKSAELLTEYHDTGKIVLKRCDTKCNLSNYYLSVLDNLLSYNGMSQKTCYHIWKFAKTFFNWLHSNEIMSLKQVDKDIVRKYLINCAERLSKSSLDTVKRQLKKLFLYLNEIGETSETFEDVFSFSVQVEKKIKKPIPLEEIAAILTSIDRSKSIGKRDYAIILLATLTGLRSVDITNLELTDIDWSNGEIKIVQEKTGKSLALPLTVDVGEAIQDYILYGRPTSDEPYVFLRSHSPHTKMGRSMPYLQFNVHRAKLGLPKASFHSLRRALGTNMVIAGVPITTVAQVLGHSGLSSTKQYISLDSVHLKECALAFDDLYVNQTEVSDNV